MKREDYINGGRDAALLADPQRSRGLQLQPEMTPLILLNIFKIGVYSREMMPQMRRHNCFITWAKNSPAKYRTRSFHGAH